jgi:hypothetical protein
MSTSVFGLNFLFKIESYNGCGVHGIGSWGLVVSH